MINVNDTTGSLVRGEQENCTPRCDGTLPEGCTENGNSDSCLDGMPLAMVYSPCQEFRSLHTVEEALQRGTLFTELDKPFWGARRLK